MRPAFLAAILVLIAAAPAQAATRRVPSEYQTVQSAVDAAADDDTVLVADGTFRGEGNRNIVMLGKRIVVVSEHGPEATIIDVEGSTELPARGFFFGGGEVPETVLDGFTIVNGYLGQLPSARAGALHDLSGAGIKVQNGAPTIRNCIVRSCYSDYTGGAMSIEILASPTIANCVFAGSGAGIQGGGVSIETGSTPVLTNCAITGNRAPIGGGVSITASATLVNCTIAGNRADRGGGLDCGPFAEPDLMRCIVWGNCAPGGPGSEIFADDGSRPVFNCSIVDTTEIDGTGEVVFATDNLHVNPLFCELAPCENAPNLMGDYRLAANSPAIEASSPCGALIGDLGVGCGGQPPAVKPTSWGRVKAAFR